MKISTGKQSDESNFSLNGVFQEGSQSEVSLGDQSGKSFRTVNIVELPLSIDTSSPARELGKVLAALHSQAGPSTPEQVSAIEGAKSAAERGDRTATAGFLAKAGKWALDTAAKVGAPLAVEALKHILF